MIAIAERVFFASFAIVAGASALTIGASHGLPGLRYNPTPSVPMGLYLYVPGATARGETVQACLPTPLATYARAHHILLAGSCTNGSEPLVKVLAAEPGDVVDVEPAAIRIDGRLWPSSAIRPFDSSGRPVDMRMPLGTQTVAPNRVLLLGLHPRSWDGRYFGTLPSSAVTGRWFPLITDTRITP